MNVRLVYKEFIPYFDKIDIVIRYKTILLFAVLYQAVMAQEKYCYDKETNAYWEDLAIRAADHLDVISLYKLRKQLCRQIDAGEITVEDATEIFVRESTHVVEGLERRRF